MKKLCSGLLVLSLGLNQVGVNCRAAKTNVELPVDSKVVQSEIEKIRFRLRQNNYEIEKIDNLKDLQVENKEMSAQNKVTETLPKKQNIVIRLLKAVGRGGAFVVKKFIWLLLVFLVSSCGSCFGVFKAIEKVAHEQSTDFMKELNSFLSFLKENSDIAESILVKLLNAIDGDGEKGIFKDCQELIKIISVKFHPDRLRKMKYLTLSKEECKEILYLSSNAADELKGASR